VRVFIQELAEVGVFNAVVRHRDLVVIAFNVVVHIGARRRGAVAIGIPHRLYLFGGHHVVFVLGVGLVFPTIHDLVDDFLGVKLGEMVVVPRGDGHIVAVAIHGVNVGGFFKLDAGVARVGVQLGEVVKDCGGIGRDRHFIN